MPCSSFQAEIKKLQQAHAQAQAVQAQAQAQAQASQGQLPTIQKAAVTTTQAVTGITHVQLTQAQRQQVGTFDYCFCLYQLRVVSLWTRCSIYLEKINELTRVSYTWTDL